MTTFTILNLSQNQLKIRKWITIKQAIHQIDVKDSDQQQVPFVWQVPIQH